MLPLSHHIFRPSLVSANILIVKTTTSSAFWTFNILSQVQWILLVFPAVFLEIFLYHTYCNSYTLTCVKIFLTIQLFEVFPIHICICSVCFECMIWVSKPCVCTFQENQGEKLLTKLKLTGTYCGLSIRVRKFSPDSFLIIIKRRARDRS